MIQRATPAPEATKQPARFRQLERVSLLVELLAPLRYGATLSELQRGISSELGRIDSERTIYRDLIELELLGVVDRIQNQGNRLRPVVWRYRSRFQRSTILRHCSEVVSETRTQTYDN
jgi:hypothetical protein